jgi:hypothetical protein
MAEDFAFDLRPLQQELKRAIRDMGSIREEDVQKLVDGLKDCQKKVNVLCDESMRFVRPKPKHTP